MMTATPVSVTIMLVTGVVVLAVLVPVLCAHGYSGQPWLETSMGPVYAAACTCDQGKTSSGRQAPRSPVFLLSGQGRLRGYCGVTTICGSCLSPVEKLT